MVFKTNGDGTAIIKIWAMVLALMMTCISIGYNVAYTVGINSVKEKIYNIEARLCENEKSTKELYNYYHKLDKEITKNFSELKALLKSN